MSGFINQPNRVHRTKSVFGLCHEEAKPKLGHGQNWAVQKFGKCCAWFVTKLNLRWCQN